MAHHSSNVQKLKPVSTKPIATRAAHGGPDCGASPTTKPPPPPIGHVVLRPHRRRVGRAGICRRRRRRLPGVRHRGARLPRVRLRPHRPHGGRLLPARLPRQRVRGRRRRRERRWVLRCRRQEPLRAAAVRSLGDPRACLPEGRRRRRCRVGAVRDLPRRGARRGDRAPAPGVRAPVPCRVHRSLAALPRHVPALPVRRR